MSRKAQAMDGRTDPEYGQGATQATGQPMQQATAVAPHPVVPDNPILPQDAQDRHQGDPRPRPEWPSSTRPRTQAGDRGAECEDRTNKVLIGLPIPTRRGEEQRAQVCPAESATGHVPCRQPNAAGTAPARGEPGNLSYYCLVAHTGETSVAVKVETWARGRGHGKRPQKVTEGALTFVALDEAAQPRTLAAGEAG
jgi:acyl-CoA thioesterase YciA